MSIPTVQNSKKDYILLLIYINVALYATAFQIQRPLEPFLVDKLVNNGSGDGGVGEYARLQSFFSLIQTVGSLITGKFLDTFGAKFGFMINFAACALSYGLLSQAYTLNMLYLSKIPSIFMAGFLCAQTLASQVTSDGADRVTALSRLTMAYTIGMILGPAIGGRLGASGDYYLGAKIAVVASILSMILTLLLPSSMLDVEATPTTSSTSTPMTAGAKSEDVDVVLIKTTKQQHGVYSIIQAVWLLLGTKLITSVANSMGQNAYPIILKNGFNFNEKTLGDSMSIVSMFNAFFNGIFLGPILKKLNWELSTIICACVFLCFVFSALQAFFTYPLVSSSFSFSSGLHEYMGLSFLSTIFQYILASSITAESTARVHPSDKGTLLGMEHAVFAVARIPAPAAGIYLLQLQGGVKGGGIAVVSFVCAGIFFFVFFVLMFFRQNPLLLKTLAPHLITKCASEEKDK